MKKIDLILLCIVAMLSIGVACYDSHATPSPVIVQLNSTEKAQAMDLAKQRQAIAQARMELNNKFQIDNDKLNEQDMALNVKAQSLCFQFKAEHKLGTTTQYRLEEFKGELVRSDSGQ